MNYQDATKEELIIELQELQQKHSSLKTAYSKAISEFRIVEKTLKKSEERYRLLFENSAEAFLLTNPDGSVYSANPEACRIFGMGEDEICKLGRDGIVDSDDPQLYSALIERKKTGKFKGELNLVKKDGTKFQAEVTSAVFVDRSGNERTSMIIRDISERKLMEEKLRASEAEYRSLFENSIIGISQSNLSNGLFRINKAYAELYGYPDTSTMLKELTDDTSILYSNPDDRQNVLEALEKKGFMGPAEFELNRRNGEKFWALVFAKEVRDDTGKLLYLQAEHIDITSQKKLERERFSSSLYTRSLIEASLDPLVTINAEGKITDLNLATEQITGINRENLIGSDFADYFTEPDKARKGYKTVFSKGEVKDYPLSILHKNGRIIDVLYNATLFKNEAGEVQGVFAAARDITERKKMEEDLRNSKKSLEKLNRHLLEVRENERSQIALNLHDDFGQRLTALNLDIAWLKSRMGVQSELVRKKFEEMSLMINDSIESIREVSSFLRPEALYDLGLVPAIGWQLKKFEKQSGIHCQYTFDPGDIKIDDSISLILYRILQEALTNIVRHSEATTTVVDIRLERNRIEMVIKDDGKGIDENEINSLKSMGIAGMMERVRSVSGRMSVKGKKGSGTIIKISIPLKISKNNDQRTHNR